MYLRLVRSLDVLFFSRAASKGWSDVSLPAATKLWPRLCFYRCLWFCPQGGGSPENPPLDQADPPRTKENPPSPRTKENPPRTKENPPPPGPGRTPPGPRRTPPPRTKENPPPGPRRTPPRTRQTPPPREEDCSIRSMSGRYASYWNAILFHYALVSKLKCTMVYIFIVGSEWNGESYTEFCRH